MCPFKCIAIIFILVVNCFIRADCYQQQSSGKLLPPRPAVRVPQKFASTSDEQYFDRVILVQVMGEVDFVQNFHVQLPSGAGANEIEFQQHSSNADVLDVGNNENIIATSGASGQSLNITVSNVFDLMVGTTNYSLTLKLRRSAEVIQSWSIHYTVVGISFYRLFISGERELVSGLENQYVVDYEDVMQTRIASENHIHVLIQYPDGTSSEDSIFDEIPHSTDLKVIFTEFRAQFQHDALACKCGRVGYYAHETGVILAGGCGYGFYRLDEGSLCFGVLYEPYRAGAIRFEVEWNSLVERYPELSEEGFTNELYVSILGVPPMVVSKIDDEDFIYRQEGGQTVTVHFFNEDLQPTRMMEFVVDGATKPFKELPGSYRSIGFPQFSQSVTFVTEPGSGNSQPWEMLYFLAEESDNEAYSVARVVPRLNYTFKYDTRLIYITSIVPGVGKTKGGETVVLSGHFAGFDTVEDTINFNGQPVDPANYVSIQEGEIQFVLPSQKTFGDSYDYQVDVRVGHAVSNTVNFRYLVTNASISFDHLGSAGEVDSNGRLIVGDCATMHLTTLVSPPTDQILSYKWSVFEAKDGKKVTEVSDAVVSKEARFAQALDIHPSALLVEHEYIVEVTVRLLGTVAESSVRLIRRNAVTIGASILRPSQRSIASPAAPLRLSAIVEPPGECFNGLHGLVFEWTAFGKTQSYSPRNATGVVTEDELKMTPARLGWEYLVPQKDLVYGNHEVTFKVFMESNPLVKGFAKSVVSILPSALIAVIRSGESRFEVNSNTDIRMYGTLSYDPDQRVLNQASTEDMTFEWTCEQSSDVSAVENHSIIGECPGGFMPGGTSASDFVVPSSLVNAVVDDVRALKYSLVVRKGARVSEPASVIVELNPDRSSQPFLTGYSIDVQDIDGNQQPLEDVKYYEPVIIDVQAPSPVISWSYEIVQPQRKTLLTTTNLIQSPAFYSPDVSNINGNRKPLGIDAFRLDPFTNYTFKVLFSGSAEFENTEVLVSFRTSQAPAVIFPEPYVMHGTIQTRFMASAELPQDDSMYVYYFLLTDSNGVEYCVGGCTGQKTAYFRVGRVGDYKLSVLLYDSQGKALLARKTLKNSIKVVHSTDTVDLYGELAILFANGDDSSWTQLAFDLASDLVNPLYSLNRNVVLREDAVDALDGVEIVQSNATKPPLQVEIDDVETAVLADGLRKIFCASRPSTGHSALGVEVATLLARMSVVPHESIYDLMATVGCCVNLAPKGTTTSFSLEQLIENLKEHAKESSQELGSRRRLLQSAGDQPQNILADIICWSGKMVTATSTSAKSEGFTNSVMNGQHSVAVVSNEAQLPSILVNGQIQNGMVTSTGEDEMIFYATGECMTEMFSLRGDQKRYLAVQALPNFVTEGSFQDEPPGKNLARMLYRTQLFAENSNGKLVEVSIAERQDIDPCFCYKLPITYNKDKLNENIGSIATMFALTEEKPFGVPAKGKGEFFNYDIDGHGVVAYDIKEGWVIVCSRTIGFVGPTTGSTRSQNTLANGAQLLGLGAIGLVGIVVAGLLFVLVAVVTSWLIAKKSVETGEAPPEALHAHDLYVERDVYGRDTITDYRRTRTTQ